MNYSISQTCHSSISALNCDIYCDVIGSLLFCCLTILYSFNKVYFRQHKRSNSPSFVHNYTFVYDRLGVRRMFPLATRKLLLYESDCFHEAGVRRTLLYILQAPNIEHGIIGDCASEGCWI